MISYEKLEQLLWCSAAVLVVAGLVVLLLLWRKLSASKLQWDAAFAGWKVAYGNYSKRHAAPAKGDEGSKVQ